MDESDKKEGPLKILKNIEGKNKDLLDAIKDQGEKQLDAIEKQKENKPKIIEKDNIAYLEDKIDKLFEMYPTSFTNKSKTLLKHLQKMKAILITGICLKKCYSPKVNFMKLDF